MSAKRTPEAPRAGTDRDGNDEFVRRLSAFFAALPPDRFPHHVELAPLLTRFSSDVQFEFGLRTFLAGLVFQHSGMVGSPTHDPATTSANDGPSPPIQPDNGRHTMADTSPHETHHQRGHHGIPGQMADRPAETSDAPLVYTDVAERRCWRCLQMFPGDSTTAPTTTPEWWLCDPCDRILLPAKQRAA